MVTFSPKNNSILGFLLTFTNSKTSVPSNLLEIKIFYNLLSLLNLEKSIIRELIKTAITEQNREGIKKFLRNQLDSSVVFYAK